MGPFPQPKLNLEKLILLKELEKLLEPKRPALTGAERQARHRAKIKATAKTGSIPVSAVAFDQAILDAMAIMVREGDPFDFAGGVLRLAAEAFIVPDQACRKIQQRLAKRKLTIINPDLI